MDANGVVLRVSLCSLEDLIRGVTRQMSMMAVAHSVSVIIKPLPTNLEHVGMLFLDRTHISQVLSNFLSNAIKFSTPGQRIEIGISLISTAKVNWGRMAYWHQMSCTLFCFAGVARCDAQCFAVVAAKHSARRRFTIRVITVCTYVFYVSADTQRLSAASAA